MQAVLRLDSYLEVLYELGAFGGYRFNCALANSQSRLCQSFWKKLRVHIFEEEKYDVFVGTIRRSRAPKQQLC